MVKGKEISTKSKKFNDLELFQKNWEITLEEEIKDLKLLEDNTIQKIKELEMLGISNLDLFKSKKIEFLNKSKSPKNELDRELDLLFDQLTGIKQLKKEDERLSKKIQDISFAIQQIKTFDKSYFEIQKRLIEVAGLLRGFKSSEIEELRQELNKLDYLWIEWENLRKKNISKKIKDKKDVLLFIRNKKTEEIEKLRNHLKQLKVLNKGKKSDEIYKELRKFPEFKNLRAVEIRNIISKIDSELKQNDFSQIEESLNKLQIDELETLKKIEIGLNSLPFLIQTLKISSNSISMTVDNQRLERMENIYLQFKNLRMSSDSSKLRKSFKLLKEEDSSSIVQKLQVLNQIPNLQIYKAEINKVLQYLKVGSLSDLENLLEKEQEKREKILIQLKRSEERIKSLKQKSSNEIAEDISYLQNLHKLIYRGEKKDGKLIERESELWSEIHQKVVNQMIQERDMLGRKSSLKATSRSAAGVKGIDLGDNDEIVSVSSTYDGENMVLIIDEHGRGKCTDLNEYRISRWNSKGILSCKKSKSDIEVDNSRSFKDLVAGTLIDYEKDSLILWTEKGFLKRFKVRDIVSTRKNRVTSGNKLIELEKGDKIKRFAKWKPLEENIQQDLKRIELERIDATP